MTLLKSTSPKVVKYSLKTQHFLSNPQHQTLSTMICAAVISIWQKRKNIRPHHLHDLCVCLFWTQLSAEQKWMNQSRCCFMAWPHLVSCGLKESDKCWTVVKSSTLYSIKIIHSSIMVSQCKCCHQSFNTTMLQTGWPLTLGFSHKLAVQGKAG